MAMFDFSLDKLETYAPERHEPEDFDAFWQATLTEARAHPLDATFEPFDAGLRLQDAFDVTFNGFGGQPIKGWLLLPKQRTGPLPCVVEYIGYGGGRGFPTDWLLVSSAGYAHFIMDTRGQGSAWQRGDTPDAGEAVGGQIPGFMTRGLLDPQAYYYRRLITDAVRAVEAARSHPDLDGRIAVQGNSQGGGLAIAVAGLVDDLNAVLPGMPFLCHYRRAVNITDSTPYSEIARYLASHPDQVERAFTTLDYHDGVNFAVRANAPAQFSVGLMDMVCPPSTIYAAYNHYAGPKEMSVYHYNGHDMGNAFGRRERLAYLHELWGGA